MYDGGSFEGFIEGWEPPFLDSLGSGHAFWEEEEEEEEEEEMWDFFS